jgi:hypothetical protein
VLRSDKTQRHSRQGHESEKNASKIKAENQAKKKAKLLIKQYENEPKDIN